METNTSRAAETQKLGEKLALTLTHHKGNRALVVGLYGELGSGKTTFVQGLARGLGISSRLRSPTFIIVRRYVLKDSNFSYLFHLDLYRLKKIQELEGLGIDELLANPKNIIVIEWFEKASALVKELDYRVDFSIKDEARFIRIMKYES